MVRHLFLVAVRGTGSGVNDSFYAALPARFQNIEKPSHIYRIGLDRMLNGILHPRERSEMKYRVHSAYDGYDIFVIHYVNNMKCCFLVDMLPFAGGKIINDMDIETTFY